MAKVISKEMDPTSEVVALVTEREELFASDRRDDLRKEVCRLVHTVSSFTLPEYSDADYVNIAAAGGLDEIETARLQIVCHIAEAEYHKRQKLAAAAGNGSEEEDGEETVEEASPEEDGDDDGDSNADKIKAKLRDYTFGPEIKLSYTRLMERHPTIHIIHTRTILVKEKTATGWDTTKAKIKAVLSAMGLEGVFICIDYAAERSRLLKLFLKCIGSIIVPFFAMYVVISMIWRFMTNPFKHLLNWLAKEFDFKTEPDAPAE